MIKQSKNHIESIYQFPNRGLEKMSKREKLFGLPLHWVNRILWVGVILLVAIDILLTLNDVVGDTWSEMMRYYGQIHPILPWITGVIVGHLFHHRDETYPARDPLRSRQLYLITLWISIILFLIGIIFMTTRFRMPELSMTFIALVAVAYGYFVWPIPRRLGDWQW